MIHQHPSGRITGNAAIIAAMIQTGLILAVWTVRGWEFYAI